MATVTFDNVQKMYGDFQAVKDLDLEIREWKVAHICGNESNHLFGDIGIDQVPRLIHH